MVRVRVFALFVAASIVAPIARSACAQEATLVPRKVFVAAVDEASKPAAEMVKTCLAGQSDPLGPALVERREDADAFAYVKAGTSSVSIRIERSDGAPIALEYRLDLGAEALSRDLLADIGLALPAREQKVTEVVVERTVEETVYTETEGVTVTVRTVPGAKVTVKGLEGTIIADELGIARIPNVPRNSSVAGRVDVPGCYPAFFSSYVGEAPIEVSVEVQAVPSWHLVLSEDFVCSRAELSWGFDPGRADAYIAADTNAPYELFAPEETLWTFRFAAGVGAWLGDPGAFFRTRFGIGLYTSIDAEPSFGISPWQSVGVEFPVRFELGSPDLAVFVQLRPSIRYAPGAPTPVGGEPTQFVTGYYYYDRWQDNPTNWHFDLSWLLGEHWFATLPELHLGISIALPL
jgi:hypothetical protein